MGRTATGSELIQVATRDVNQARSVTELRVAQAVLIPLVMGLDLADTARMVGRSKGWVAVQRKKYIKNGCYVPSPTHKPRGGRKNFVLSPEKEDRLVNQAWRDAVLKSWQWVLGRYFPGSVVVSRAEARMPVSGHVKLAVERHIGKSVALSTVYQMMNRVAARKFVDGEARDWEDMRRIMHNSMYL